MRKNKSEEKRARERERRERQAKWRKRKGNRNEAEAGRGRKQKGEKKEWAHNRPALIAYMQQVTLSERRGKMHACRRSFCSLHFLLIKFFLFLFFGIFISLPFLVFSSPFFHSPSFLHIIILRFTTYLGSHGHQGRDLGHFQSARGQCPDSN